MRESLVAEPALTASGIVARTKYRLGTVLGRPRREAILKVLPKRSIGAEVGVFKGQFTRWILTIVQPAELHLIDAWWLLYGDRYPDWGAYTDFGKLSTRAAFESAKGVVARYDRYRASRFHVADDLEALAGLPDHHLDWAYLDSSHEYEHTREELELLSVKLKDQGIILGDDWREDPTHLHHGVCKAVREFCSAGEWHLGSTDKFRQWQIQRRIP